MRELYEQRAEADGETRLTHAAYDALGGLQGAIAAEAERAVAGLPAGAVETLPRLLRQLAEPARDSRALTLREAAQDEVSAEPAEAALVGALLAARILIARKDAAGHPTLRLAHDAVLTSWPQAAAAAQASRDFYRVRSEVEDAQRRWQEYGRPADRLIQPGVPLAEAEKLTGDFGRELPAELTGFVAASRNRARARQRLVAAAAIFSLFWRSPRPVPASWPTGNSNRPTASAIGPSRRSPPPRRRRTASSSTWHSVSATRSGFPPRWSKTFSIGRLRSRIN